MDEQYPTSLEFRYRVGIGVDASLTLGPDFLQFKRRSRVVQFPLADVRHFGLRNGGGPILGMTNSQLVFQLRSDAGETWNLRLPFDPRSQVCQHALEALRARLPDADLTQLAWPAAAKRLGIERRPWHQAVNNPQVITGIVVVLVVNIVANLLRDFESRATGLVALCYAVVMLVVLGMGITLLVRGIRAGRWGE